MRHFMIESLESRQLLHGLPSGMGGPSGGGGRGPGGPPPRGPGSGGPGGSGGGASGVHQPAQAVTLSLLSTAIQTGLQTLATSAGLDLLTDDTLVRLGNLEGKSTYSVAVTDSSTGTETTTILTVDATGAPISKPAITETTFGDLTSANTGTYTAAAAQITAIAAALNLEAPADDTIVNVRTTTGGEIILSVKLARADDDSTEYRPDDTIISVDLAGNPVGNQKIPAAVISAAITAGLAALAPAGADAAETIRVRTIDGVTLYSATYTVDDVATTVTVDKTGASASLPTDSTATFADLTAAAKAEIKALAEARNVTEGITDDTEVAVHTEADGTILYTVTLDAETTGRDGETINLELSITVDAEGNPAVTPPPAPQTRGERPSFSGPRIGLPPSEVSGSTDDESSESCNTPSDESTETDDSTDDSTTDTETGTDTSDSSSDDTSDTTTDETSTEPTTAAVTATTKTEAKESKAEAKAAKLAAKQAAKEARAEALAEAKTAKAAAKLARLASKTKITA